MPLASRLFGWSVLGDLIADRLNIFAGWFYDEVRAAPPCSGGPVSCLLMQRLAGLGLPVAVLAEYPRSHWLADETGKARDYTKGRAVLDCAGKAGLIPIDMSVLLKPVVQARGVDALFRSEHHSAEGNRITAAAITRELERRDLLRPSAD